MKKSRRNASMPDNETILQTLLLTKHTDTPETTEYLLPFYFALCLKLFIR